MKNLISNSMVAATSVMLFCSEALASGGTTVYTSGILALVFLGFVVMIVVFQYIPALVTLFGMLKALAKTAKPMEKSHARSNVR